MHSKDPNSVDSHGANTEGIIMTDEQQSEFLKNSVQTVLGTNKKLLESAPMIMWGVLALLATFLIPLLVQVQAVAIAVPIGINLIGTAIIDCTANPHKMKTGYGVFKYITIALYTWLWTGHVYNMATYHTSEAVLIFFSAISIATSLGTIFLLPVKEFSGIGGYDEVSLDSTLFGRAYLAIPLLLGEFIAYQAEGSGDSARLKPLRTLNSLLFLVWVLGWLRNFRNALFFTLNRIGTFLFGNEAQPTLASAGIGLLIGMIPIITYEITYWRKNGEVILQSLIVGTTLSSIMTYSRYGKYYTTLNPSDNNFRQILLIVVELIICLVLNLVNTYANFDGVSLSAVLAVDFGLYLLFSILKEMARAWSRIGCTIQLGILNHRAILAIERIILRVVSAVAVITIMTNYRQQWTNRFNFAQSIIEYIIIPLLGYRAFKRTMSQTNTFSLHISMLICLILINNGFEGTGTLLVLIFPPLPPNPYLTLVGIFCMGPNQARFNTFCWKLLFIFVASIGFILHVGTLGIFQFSMVFGLPLFYPVQTLESQNHQSHEGSIEEVIMQCLDSKRFSYYEAGYYLLKLNQYFLLMEVKVNCFGFCEISDFRGIDVTQRGDDDEELQTIDKLITETWGAQRKGCSLWPYTIALAPVGKYRTKVPSLEEIDIKGAAQTANFDKVLGPIALKAIIYEYCMLQLNKDQKKSVKNINQNWQKKWEAQARNIEFPEDFLKECFEQCQKKEKKEQELTQIGVQTNLTQEQQSAQRAIRVFYLTALGSQGKVDMETVYKLMKREPQSQLLDDLDFEDLNKLIGRALSKALRVAVDKINTGTQGVSYREFQEMSKSFVGPANIHELKDSLNDEEKERIEIFASEDKKLRLMRVRTEWGDMFSFKVDEMIIKAVWNNLRFEKAYLENNNPQRLSMQTNPHLLRKMWSDACEIPFGKPTFHSGPLRCK